MLRKLNHLSFCSVKSFSLISKNRCSYRNCTVICQDLIFGSRFIIQFYLLDTSGKRITVSRNPFCASKRHRSRFPLHFINKISLVNFPLLYKLLIQIYFIIVVLFYRKRDRMPLIIRKIHIIYRKISVIIYSCVFTEFKADFISAADIQRHVMIRMLVSVDRGQRLQISTACLKTQRDCTTSQIVYKRHVFLWYFKTLINALNLLFFTQILLAQNFCRFCICRCLNSFRTFILSKNRHGALGHHSECQKDRHYFFLLAHLSFFQ